MRALLVIAVAAAARGEPTPAAIFRGVATVDTAASEYRGELRGQTGLKT